MKYWLSSSLLLSSALLTACVSTTKPNDLSKRKMRPPTLQTPAQATREIKLTAPEFRADAPERYIVKRGDTLWGIANRFLKSPARWKEVWHANPQIKNPNKIYPGDIISYKTVGGVRKLQIAGSNSPARNQFAGRTRDGRPVYNVHPTVRTEPLYQPIPTIPKEIVYPFMTKNRIFEPGFSDDYPYVVGQADRGYIALSGRNKVYARSDYGFDDTLYDVFREAKPIKDPEAGDIIGVEAIYVGQLKLVERANDDGVGTFIQTDKVNPLYPKDILIPSKAAEIGGDLSFFPKLPEATEGVIVVRPMGNFSPHTGSQFGTMLINGGKDIGVREGDVFKIVRAKEQMGRGRDGDEFRMPDYEVGMGIIYKVNDETSFLLVMSAYDVIYPGDRLVSP
ncbi:MAG: hypothetical protein CR974_00400 [Gammaproteobacteria bacterium]|nr:MAG: hypothetical protein CR974_00400 [Gammaproteobacteria bacterium]